tara:strand:- start:802 stop:1659 length:858 start_codon:yes stop_codon:yes gene_type:complete
MAFVVADRVKETTTTTGTGTITLGGAEPNFITFTSALSDGDTTYYAIVDDTNLAFEVGLGTFTASGTTLARTTVLASSNSGSAVNLQAGTKDVFINYPAGKSVFLNASNQLVINGTAVTATAAEINYLDITTLGTSEASKAVTADSGAKVKFIGTTSVAEMIEKVTTQTSTTGTINFDFLTQAVEFYTANQGANRTINFRGDGSTALNSVMATGESMTAAILMTQGSSAYYLNTYQVDGSSVTPEWSGGSAPSSGNASSIDAYVFTIIKTADATFTVLASQTQYA